MEGNEFHIDSTLNQKKNMQYQSLMFTRGPFLKVLHLYTNQMTLTHFGAEHTNSQRKNCEL